MWLCVDSVGWHLLLVTLPDALSTNDPRRLTKRRLGELFHRWAERHHNCALDSLGSTLNSRIEFGGDRVELGVCLGRLYCRRQELCPVWAGVSPLGQVLFCG